MSPERTVVPGTEDLADAVAAFVRAFGLHRPERTPCGFEASVAEAHALGELRHGDLQQGELVDRLGLTKSTVSRLVDQLEARGWVQRQPVDGDRRAVVVTLTAAGRDAGDRLARARAQRLGALLKAVPDERRDDVTEVLAIMVEAARASDPRHA